MPTTYAYVEFPPPTVTGPACQVCEGRGVTGEQYQMPTGQDRVLLVDVVCSACGGCGSAEHAGCAGAHAGLDDADPWDDAEVDGDQPDQDACPSCLGREWNPLQGFDPTSRSSEIRVLRVPCGCTTARARVWTAAAKRQGRER